MSDIFISYSSEDRGKAKDIADALEQQGFSSVWWDRDILPGKPWDTVIEEALDAANCVIVLWSKTSVSSEWVKAEASEGKQRRILITVLIEREEKIPLAIKLMKAADLRDWKDKLPHPGFDSLLKAVAGILGRPVQPSQRMEPEKLAKQGSNSIGMKFTLIKAGESYMGSEESYDEKPVHKVEIKNPFYLGTYPVTQAEWKAVMDDDPSHFKGDNLPVEQVSWDYVQKFIKKLNEKEGTGKYRLPSEAEWEYTCRAGTSTRYSFGDSESKLGEYAWYLKNSVEKTHPVGQKEPNSWGLHDMHGNVWEWVQDKWHDSYDGAPTDGSAWKSGDGADRVIRGGSWDYDTGVCRSAVRDDDNPRYRSDDLGFRLLREQ
jgi:formylglycine-generating enzyme required for sulfatase activity